MPYTFLQAAQLPLLSAHRITSLLAVASYTKHISRTEHTWTIRMLGNDWTENWGWLTVKGEGDDVVWWHSDYVCLRFFPATLWTVCNVVNNSLNLRCTTIFSREKFEERCMLYLK
jgi:hypothetical protein